MRRAGNVVCGKAKYHEIVDNDSPHGSWIMATDRKKGHCGFIARPRTVRVGPLVHCADCDARFTERSRAKVHWWVHVREARPKKLKPIKHGTNAGYFGHRRRDQEACDECKAAHAAYTKTKLNEWERANHFQRRGNSDWMYGRPR